MAIGSRGAIAPQPQARSAAEDGGRRLFCLAMQSRASARRRKKAGARRCGSAIEAGAAPSARSGHPRRHGRACGRAGRRHGGVRIATPREETPLGVQEPVPASAWRQRLAQGSIRQGPAIRLDSGTPARGWTSSSVRPATARSRVNGQRTPVSPIRMVRDGTADRCIPAFRARCDTTERPYRRPHYPAGKRCRGRGHRDFHGSGAPQARPPRTAELTCRSRRSTGIAATKPGAGRPRPPRPCRMMIEDVIIQRLGFHRGLEAKRRMDGAFQCLYKDDILNIGRGKNANGSERGSEGVA